MHSTALVLPRRECKPRACGTTMMIDTGLPTRQFADVVASFAPLIDVVKFGWGTALVTDDIKYKIDALREHDVDYYFGGTLFEIFAAQDAVDDWRRYVDAFGCRTVEISNGTIPMSNTAKAEYVARFTPELRVYSEVGFKDPTQSEHLSPQQWVDYICEDLEAGAYKVITEARESGRSGICRADGTLRTDLIRKIARSGIDMTDLVFEAPTKDLQVAMIREFGANVNLGNVAVADIVGLETLRTGLRGDTLLDFTTPLAVAHA
ncbi:phosphosulfolactate synthase [uncultured Jatrophihabitans sp.]|uniref:phosphosulfolactate synthase n=1 Tax=uncultured Jatrophihabitans sp. TaxID=1610747 RepID=UPI0035CBC4B1